MQTVKAFLQQANFYPKLERWIFEKNIYVAAMDAGFDVTRIKRIPELGVVAVTGKTTLAREAQFEQGPTTRIKNAIRERGLTINTDYVDMYHQDHAIIVVFGVELPKISETHRRQSRGRRDTRSVRGL